MSTSTITAVATQPAQREDQGHRRRVQACATAAVLGTAALLAYGFSYYFASAGNRPYHPRHMVLRSSGAIGWWLGIFGVGLFGLIFLYPLRKRWKWLARKGNSQHWFDYHIVMGMAAPVVIAFHASFRFRGIAGMAYWIMFAVAASGIIGRYLYSQVPRSRNNTELSLQELRDVQERLTERLAAQRLVKQHDLDQLFRLPSAKYVERESMLRALCSLLWIDMKRPLREARLRRHSLRFFGKLSTAGGLLSSNNHELERIIALAREQAGLAKKLLFLTKSQQVFQLWHVVHRPFSYSFAVLAVLHIAIAVMFRTG